MNKFVKGLSAALVVGMSLCATSISANAAVIYESYVDRYIGGTGVGVSNPTGDVIGNLNKYDTTGAVVEKTDVDSDFQEDDLKIKIFSNYFNNIGSHGTSLGALFIGTTDQGPGMTNLDLEAMLSGDNTGDTFALDSARFQYAVEFDGNDRPTKDSPLVDSGAAKVYSITGAGDVIESDDITGNGFRGDQAIRPSLSALIANEVDGTQGNASWSLDANQAEADNYLEFVIKDYFTDDFNANVRTTDFVFAYAMSCANDVWLDIVTIGQEGPGPVVPLPAGFVLLLTGLLGIGWLGRSRAKQA